MMARICLATPAGRLGCESSCATVCPLVTSHLVPGTASSRVARVRAALPLRRHASGASPHRPLVVRTAAPRYPPSSRRVPVRGTPAGAPQAAMSGDDLPCPSVPAREVSPLLEGGGCTYLDVRTPDNFETGHVPGAVNIPVMKPGPEGLVVIDEFVANVEVKFPRDARLVVGCNSGGRSKRASRMLVEAGFTNVTNVADGFQGWVAAGQPVEK